MKTLYWNTNANTLVLKYTFWLLMVFPMFKHTVFDWKKVKMTRRLVKEITEFSESVKELILLNILFR